MGIQGLLQALKPATERCHIREYRGRVVGVDAYVWLHRGAYGCAFDLCSGGAAATAVYIRYFISMVDLLLENGVSPYLVFDGGHLPAKAEQEALRNGRREEAMQLALQLQQQGDHTGARNQYVRAVDVNPEMAARVIHALKQCRPGVKYVVAPYEADAQLAYLCKEGLISAVISEDSDTLPYGCADVMFKLERSGEGQRIQLERVFLTKIPGFDLRGFDQNMFVTMCILSGCDYLPSLPGMGLKKARNYVVKHKVHSRLFRMLKLDGTLSALRSEQYEADFEKAWLTFAHQVVYDVTTATTRHLTPIQMSDEAMAKYAGNFAFLGTTLNEDAAQSIAAGLMDPITNSQFQLGGMDMEFLPPPAQDAGLVAAIPRIDSFFKPQPVARAPSPAWQEGKQCASGSQRRHSPGPAQRFSPVPFDREAVGSGSSCDSVHSSQLSDSTSVESMSASTSQSSTTSALAQTPSGPRRSAFFANSTPSTTASASPALSAFASQEQQPLQPVEENLPFEVQHQHQHHHQQQPPPPLLKCRSYISHRHARVAGIQRRHSLTQHSTAQRDKGHNKENCPVSAGATTTKPTTAAATGKKRGRPTAATAPSITTDATCAATSSSHDVRTRARSNSVPATPEGNRRVDYRDSVSPPTNVFAQYTCELSLEVTAAATTPSTSSKSPTTSGVQHDERLRQDTTAWLTRLRETVADSDHDAAEDDSDALSMFNSPLKKTKSAPPSLSVRSLDEFRFVTESI